MIDKAPEERERGITINISHVEYQTDETTAMSTSTTKESDAQAELVQHVKDAISVFKVADSEDRGRSSRKALRG